MQKGILIIGGFFLIIMIMLYLSNKKTLPERIDDLRAQANPMFDSLSKQMNRENDFTKRILLLIQQKETDSATQLINSAIRNNPATGILHIYKGMIYASDEKYIQALKQYDTSVLLDKVEYPLVLSKKAEAFIGLKNYINAIDSYKKAAFLNTDFYFEIAQTFELINKKDSALAYYKLYQMKYPDDSSAQKRIILLSGSHIN